MSNKALNFLLNKHAEKKNKIYAKEKEQQVKHYLPNEYGFYTMQQCYIINNMLANGAKIESDGLFNYTNKNGDTKTHKIENMTAYNMSIDYYEQLRQLGVKGCVELLKWNDDTIELVRKVNNSYYLTTITESGLVDTPYNASKQLLQFIKV